MINKNKCFVLFTFLFALLITVLATAQDSSLVKINYVFSYDYHDYNYRHLYSSPVKPGFCYSNRLGIQINEHFLKKRRLCVGVELFLGNKQMNVTSEYKRLIDSTGNAKYDKQKDYKFKYDYWVTGGLLKFSYLFKKRIEPWIGAEFNFDFLHKKNFEQDSIKEYNLYGSTSYYYSRTYFLPQNLYLLGIDVGLNFYLTHYLQLVFFSSYLFDPSPEEQQGMGATRVLFNKYKSFGVQINFKIF